MKRSRTVMNLSDISIPSERLLGFSMFESNCNLTEALLQQQPMKKFVSFDDFIAKKDLVLPAMKPDFTKSTLSNGMKLSKLQNRNVSWDLANKVLVNDDMDSNMFGEFSLNTNDESSSIPTIEGRISQLRVSV